MIKLNVEVTEMAEKHPYDLARRHGKDWGGGE